MSVVAVEDRTVDLSPSEQKEVMTLAEFNTKASQLRELLENARDAEDRAFKKLKNLQLEMIRCVTADNNQSFSLYERSYEEGEAEWRACSLYSAELRAEIQDLYRERHGVPDPTAPPAESPTTPHSKSVHLMRIGANAVSGGYAVSLDRAKPIPLAPDDLSPQRRPLIKKAFPDLDPALENNAQNLPIGESQLQQEFERLDVHRNTYLTLTQTLDYFNTLDRMGLPLSSDDFVITTLGKHDATLRRLLSRRTPLAVVKAEHGNTFHVSFAAFALLMTKWAQM